MIRFIIARLAFQQGRKEEDEVFLGSTAFTAEYRWMRSVFVCVNFRSLPF